MTAAIPKVHDFVEWTEYDVDHNPHKAFGVIREIDQVHGSATVEVLKLVKLDKLSVAGFQTSQEPVQ